MRIRQIPRDDERCGWLAGWGEGAPARRWAGEGRSDVVVVGAGFTGLAAARRLAAVRPGWRVVVLEGQRAGFGASGRSSGFVVALAGFIAAMETEEQERFIRLSRSGMDELRGLVERHGIDCEWDDKGWLHVAASDAGMASLESLTAWLDRRGERYERLDSQGMEGLVGSIYYRAGVRLPGSVLVHPGTLMAGLARALPPEAELYEESPVVRIERQGGQWRLETPGGSVAVPRVVWATNGALATLAPLRRRLFPLYTFGSLTRPLTEPEQERLGGEREWGLLAQDVMGSSLRRTRDQRLLIRNTTFYSRRLARVPERVRAHAAAEHRRALAARFPELAELPFEHTWAGLMGMSGNLRPFFGELAPGLVAAGGYHGAGISFGTAAGRLLADLAAGEESEDLAAIRALPGPRWIPPEPFLGLGVRARLLWDHHVRAGGRI